MFAKMWGAPDPKPDGEENDVWGAVTSCGTEGNLHARLLMF